ncbi:MAG: VIT domain-containing protein [Kofleriaceae bacterium]
MIPIPVDSLPDRACPAGGWGALDTARGRLPLAAVDVEARIVGLVCTTEVRQTFVNHHADVIEATYVFPLPDRHAVQRLRMVVGDRVIEGVIDERGAARATYEAAIAEGHRAALAEEDRAGVFTMTVGNIGPGEVVTVSLAMSGPVLIDDGEVTWTFPLVVAPRYCPGAPLPGEQAGLGIVGDTDAAPDASRISPPVLLPGMPSPVRLGVRVTIDGGGLPVANLRASVAELDARQTSGGWSVVLRPGQRLDQDLILRWDAGGAAMTTSAVWAPDADGAAATLAVTILPPLASARASRPRDVVILLDRSGSMEGWKMVAARRAAARVVDSLTARDRFAALAFDDRIETPPALPGLVDATDRHRFAAVEFLARVDSRGGTELVHALGQGLATLPPAPGRDQVLVLITDGQIANEDQVLAQFGARLGELRVFTLGIDRAVNAAFLRRLAGFGDGACELVESEDRLDEAMGTIHQRIATPVLTRLEVAGASLVPTLQAPRRPPAVFAGAPVTIYQRYHRLPSERQTVDVFGRLPDGAPWNATIPVTRAAIAVDLEATWARARIRDLEDRYAAGDTNPALCEEIVQVSKAHRVLSRFTAFVAVDGAHTVVGGGRPRQVRQPVERPAAAPTGMPPALGQMRTQSGIVTPAHQAEYERLVDKWAAAPAPVPRSPTSPAFKAEASKADAPGPSRSRSAPPPPSVPPTAPPPPTAMRGDRAPHAGFAAPSPDTQAYRQRLRLLADDLDASTRAADPQEAAARVLARLAELLDDARAAAVPDLPGQLTPLIEELTQALATRAWARTLARVVTALRELSDGAPPTPPRRRSFWK